MPTDAQWRVLAAQIGAATSTAQERAAWAAFAQALAAPGPAPTPVPTPTPTPTPVPTPTPTPTPTGAVGPVATTAPAGAIVANPTDSLATKVTATPTGGTLYLNAGVYAQALPAKAITVIGALGATIDGQNTRTSGITGTATGMKVRNLDFRNYKNPAQQPVVDARNLPKLEVTNCSVHSFTGVGICGGGGGIIDSCDIYDGDQLGLMADNTGGTIRNTLVHNINKVGSATQTNPNQVKVGTRWFYEPGWEAGGSKFWATDGLSVIGCKFYDCGGPGIWFDTQNVRYLIDSNEVYRCDWAGSDNSANGIFIEVSHGGVIKNNNVHDCGNLWHPWVWNAGIQIAASDGVEVFGNRVTNCGNGIAMPTQDRDDNGTTWKTINCSIHDNTINGAGLSGAAYDGQGRDPCTAAANNKWVNNHYTGGHRFAWNDNDGLTWAQWQAAGQDKTGTYA